MKRLLFLGALLLALAGRAQAQAAPVALVVVEVLNESDRLTVAISRGPGQTTQTEVSFKPDRLATSARAEAYFNLFRQLYDEGYTLQSSSNSTAYPNYGRVTYLFVKAAPR